MKGVLPALGGVGSRGTIKGGADGASGRVSARRRWKGRRRRWYRAAGLGFAWFIVGMFVLVSIVAALSWGLGGDDGFLGADAGCAHNSFGCNTAVEFLGTASALALAFVYFASWRVGRVTKHHLKDAPTRPWRMVPTATQVDE